MFEYSATERVANLRETLSNSPRCSSKETVDPGWGGCYGYDPRLNLRSELIGHEKWPCTWTNATCHGFVAQSFLRAERLLLLEADMKMVYEHNDTGERLRITIKRLCNGPLGFCAEPGSFSVTRNGVGDAATEPGAIHEVYGLPKVYVKENVTRLITGHADTKPEADYEVVGTTVPVPNNSPGHEVRIRVVDVKSKTTAIDADQNTAGQTQVDEQSRPEKWYQLEIRITSLARPLVELEARQVTGV